MYDDRDFALILSKASELARSSDATEQTSVGFSLDDMKAIAEEAGLDPVLVERAARLMQVDGGQSGWERVLGGPLKLRLDAHFAAKPTEERNAHLLSAVRAAVEQHGEGEANSSGMSWNSVGEGSQILVTSHAEQDGTLVRVVVDRRGALAITATFTVMASLAVGVLTLVTLDAVDVQSALLGWGVFGGGVTGVLAAGRTVWATTARGLRAKMSSLMETISRSMGEEHADRPASSEGTGDRDGEGEKGEPGGHGAAAR